MSTQAALGQKALEKGDYEAAIKHYSDALKSSISPLWLMQRSTAYQRQGKHELALGDAENAVHQATSRGRRELMAAAQMRRAIALFSLRRFGDARLCFTWVRKMNEKEKGLGMWQAKVVQEYDRLDENAAERQTTIKETPDTVERVVPTKSHSGTSTSDRMTKTAVTAMPSSAPTDTAILASGQPPKEKIRHEWFQSSNKVTITIFAKKVNKDQADIQFAENSLEVSFPTSSGGNYDFTLSPLFSSIDISQSIYSITPNKIEISLHKSMSGLKWSALEGINTAAFITSKDAIRASAPQPANLTTEKAPTYPTSSKKGAKNWDAVAQDELQKAKKEGSKDSDAAATAVDDDDLDEEGDPLQGFFKKLYKDANPDTRRAMMKSYVESNGTALSTNWEDVGKAPVPVNPPDGIEARKWEA